MKKIILTLLLLVGVVSTAVAVPAKPGFRNYRQTDGTTITVQLVGDENFHTFVTPDGLCVDMDDRGDFYYRGNEGMTAVRAHNQGERTADELSYVAEHQPDIALEGVDMAQRGVHKMAQRRKVGQTQVPTMGSPRVPIILVQYTDKKMVNTVEQFEAHYKTDAKSVLKYFTDQSNGKYTPQFDIYGIYDLPSDRATYGGNNSRGDDRGVALMVCDAIDKAGDNIDWSKYDNDGDGEADVCIVVYAGVGEAQSSVRNAVWPCQWSLSAGAYYGDGTGARHRNGVTIDRFAVFNEIYGSSDYGQMLDGIGVFCHEFSHCLGLPDFYCTTYSGHYGMGGWSLMNSGCYNGGDISGDTPIGYCAYEKAFMGWIDYIEPIEDTRYTLPVFNTGSVDSDQAIRITSHLNENEYFILENRRKQGWDQYIADEGVLITHFTYVADRWEENTVNNNTIQLATVMAADNALNGSTEHNDLFGESNHEFTATSKPAMKLNMRANGSLASSTGGAGSLNKPVTGIELNDDGTASLWYVKAPDPVLYVTGTDLNMTTQIDTTTAATFRVRGVSLPAPVTLTLSDETGAFSIDKTELTADEVKTSQAITVTFAPRQLGQHNATVTVACEGVDTVVVNLTGRALIVSEVPVMQPVDSESVTQTSFRADWTDGTPVENVKSYNLYVDYVRPVVLPELLQDADFSDLTQVMTDSQWFPTYKNVADECELYLPEGWHATSPFYVTNGAILLGDTLTTSTFEIADRYDKISVVANAWSHNAVTYGRASLKITATGSGATLTQSVGNMAGEVAFVLDAARTESLIIKGINYPMISDIKIYGGDVNVKEDAPLLAVVEQGDSLNRVIEGITDTHHLVTGLIAGGTYKYKVEAIYVDDTRSPMSNIERVTLNSLTGDVNADGVVDIADVNILINIMLGKDAAENYGSRAFVTAGDTNVDISDVNTVINIMLGK